MGSETSKLTAPEEFGQSGNQFQILSPVSDLSCPSDINRINRIRSQQRNPHPSDPGRRTSRTVTKTLHQPKHPSVRHSGVPPPSHFYFPTKDTERAAEKVERRSLQSEKENERPMILNKTKKILQKTQKAMAGCFAEDNAEQMEAEQRIEESKHHPTLGIARKVLPKTAYHVSEYDAKSTYKAMEDPSVTPVDDRRGGKSKQYSSKTLESQSKRESSARPLLQESAKSTSLCAAQAALHQADDYFTRLTAGSAEESPYVQNKSVQKVTSVLDKDDPESPVSVLFSEMQENQSVLSKTVDSIIESSLAESDVKRNRHSLSSSDHQGKGNISPSSSAFEYQKAIGTIAETPGYYPDDEDEESDPVFSDDTVEDDRQVNKHTEKADKTAKALFEENQIVLKVSSELATIREKVDDESSSPMSDLQSKEKNTDSAFRPRTSMNKKSHKQIKLVLASCETSNRKVSKLESLFRPVMPSLSADDAHTTSSYDRWEIKVTESAPSAMETADYRTMAMNVKNCSPERTTNLTALEKKLRGSFSPSMMSIDSQIDASPPSTKETVSLQALSNAEFLFKSDKKKAKLLKAPSDLDSDSFSINTSGARSRISNRTGTKAVVIHDKNSFANDVQSQYSRESDRRVRFSLLDAVSGSVGLAPKESIDVPTIETKLSDLTDIGARRSSASTSRSSIVKPIESVKEGISLESIPLTAQPSSSKKDEEIKKSEGHWSYRNDGVTPHRNGMNTKDATNSPYLRFQSAKTRFESQPVVEVPEIQNKVSDLTDDTGDYKGRGSVGSAKSIPETVQEELETETPESMSDKSQMQVHWSYSVKDGNQTAVTPYFGNDAKLATKSPYIRFENAKNKFSSKTASNSLALVKKDTAIVKKETSIVMISSPFKSPRSSRAKQAIRKTRQLPSGCSVASRIEELNQRVVEAKIDRKKHRWTKSNPRKYGVIDSNAVRTRAIVQYKTDVVGLDRFNYMSAAKFNSIPIDDDSSVESSAAGSRHSKKSVTFAEPRPLLVPAEQDAEDDFDDTDDWSKLTADTSSVATVRREKPVASNTYPSSGARVSEGTYSTTSSGLTNVKKQVFRGSMSTTSSSRHSLLSHGESTTMSSILDKENSTHLPFRANANTVKPTEQTIVAKPDPHLSSSRQTPMQAQKWRTLAAAAHQRDSQKKQTSGKMRKGLAVKTENKLPLASLV